jgi:hypothetical protein
MRERVTFGEWLVVLMFAVLMFGCLAGAALVF